MAMFKFKIGDRIVADWGRFWYKAKILNRRIDEEGDRIYHLSFDGFTKSAEEWVIENMIHPRNAESLGILKQKLEDGKKEEKEKRQSLRASATPKGRKSSTRASIGKAKEKNPPKTPSRGRRSSKVKIDVEIACEPNLIDENIPQNDDKVEQVPKKRAASRGKSKTPKKAKKAAANEEGVRLQIPTFLLQWAADEFLRAKKNKLELTLPVKPCVKDILDQYLASRKEEYTDEQQEIDKIVCNWIIAEVDQNFEAILYSGEKIQYKALETSVPPSKCLGRSHLLRFFLLLDHNLLSILDAKAALQYVVHYINDNFKSLTN